MSVSVPVDENAKMDICEDNLTSDCSQRDYISTLNEDCLLLIFEQLNFFNLTKMCVMKKRFRDIIPDRFFRRLTVDFKGINDLLSIKDAFKQFGEKIVKLKISADDVDYIADNEARTSEILLLIKNHCTAGKLKELEISGSFKKVTLPEIREVGPMFQNLERLTLNGILKARVSLSVIVIETFLRYPTDLKTLEIRNADFYGLMDNQLMLKLTELRLEDCLLRYSSDLNHYFRKNPNLKAFHHKTTRGLSTLLYEHIMLRAIVKYLPNLEVLSLENSMAESYDYDPILKLDKLKQLKIVSYTHDCNCMYNFLKKLALKNTVEKLIIVIKQNYYRHFPREWNDEFPNFSSLRSFEVVNPIRKTEPFLTHFVKNVTNLTEFTIRSPAAITQEIIVNVATHANQLKVLVLLSHRTGLYRLYQQIYDGIKDSRDTCLELRVDPEQRIKYLSSRKYRHSHEQVLKITSYSN